MQTSEVIISRDVKFVETTFPFSYLAPLSKLFPAYFSSNIESVFSSSNEYVPSSPYTVVSPNNSTSQLGRSPSFHSPPSISPILNIPTSVSSEEVLPSVFKHQLRRLQRDHNPPKYLSDYICDTIFTIVSPNPPCLPFYHSSFSTMTPQNLTLITSIYQITEPTSYQQVMMHPGWKVAMDKEFEALNSNKAWDIVQLPKARNL